MRRKTFWLPAAIFILAAAGCTQHKVEVAKMTCPGTGKNDLSRPRQK